MSMDRVTGAGSSINNRSHFPSHCHPKGLLLNAVAKIILSPFLIILIDRLHLVPFASKRPFYVEECLLAWELPVMNNNGSHCPWLRADCVPARPCNNNSSTPAPLTSPLLGDASVRPPYRSENEAQPRKAPGPRPTELSP